MIETRAQRSRYWEKSKPLIVALCLGFAAMLLLKAGVSIPIPGTKVVTDPRELLVTVGSAITGPVGSLVIGFLAGIGEPDAKIRWISIVIHVAGGLWMSLAYKYLVYPLPRLRLLFGWAGLIVGYYCFFIVSLSIFLLSRDSLLFSEVMGEGVTVAQSFRLFALGILPEVVITLVFTTLVIFALSGVYRRPLW